MTMTNQQKNTASVTNQANSQSKRQWGDYSGTWAQFQGQFQASYTIKNQTKNTASLTNQSKS